jgi:hypothetical protein
LTFVGTLIEVSARRTPINRGTAQLKQCSEVSDEDGDSWEGYTRERVQLEAMVVLR